MHTDLDDAIVIIGGGPVGLVTALLLAEQGAEVHVFEGRQDPRRTQRGRAISLTLTQRGWTAIRRAGLEEQVREIATPLRGRSIHLETGEVKYQPYGTRGEAIDCVSRPVLTARLMCAAERRKGVHLHVGWRCVGASPEAGLLTFEDPEGETTVVRSRRALAADGATSAIRNSLLTRSEFDLSRTYSKFFYKELRVPLQEDGAWPFDPNAIHIWPRGDCMLTGFPSHGAGFTCTLFMPMEGSRSFSGLSRPRDVMSFFETTFPDLTPLMPDVLNDYYAGAPSYLVSLQCFPWVFSGLALIGDAAHAMVPFLGQGLNAGLEDASVLVDCVLDEGEGGWQRALVRYQALRKPNCDAIGELAEQHYLELAEATRDPAFVLRKRLENRLGELFPDELPSPYHVVSFSDRPYVEARRAATLQRTVIEQLLSRAGIIHTLDSGRTDDELVSLARGLLGPDAELGAIEGGKMDLTPPSGDEIVRH